MTTCCVFALMSLFIVTAMAQSLHSETDQNGHRKLTNVFDAATPAGDGRMTVAFYKQVDPEGRVSYGDGADPLRAVALPSGIMVSSSDVASALARNAAISSRRAAMIDASEAARRLAQAKRERLLGIALLPGEDNGVAQPGTAIGRYQLRQNRLNSRVESAQVRVSNTQR
jgi:hypothetical protein